MKTNMRKILSICSLIIFVACVSKAQVYNYEPIPEWVKPVKIPKMTNTSKYDISSGYYLTLADYQVNLE